MNTGYFRQDWIEGQYIDSMGTDLTVVNAARVSFDKESDWESKKIKKLIDTDEKLIKYLAKHKHWSPFAHAQIQFRIKAPIFVARQLVKHQVGLVWNEVSRRYVSSEPTYYYPESFRAAVKNVKQGSSETDHITTLKTNKFGENNIFAAYEDSIEEAHTFYMDMINAGVAPEIARAVLPTASMTEWYWTGSLYAFARVCNERLDPHAQYETRLVAEQISNVCQILFPVSWKELVTNNLITKKEGI